MGSGGEVGVRAERWPEVYFAAAQFEGPPWNRFWVRPAVGPEAFGEILRAAVAAVNPASPSPRRPRIHIFVLFLHPMNVMELLQNAIARTWFAVGKL